MNGNFIDIIRYGFKTKSIAWKSNTKIISTQYGNIRMLDTQSNMPVIITVPDGPNVIEHQEKLIVELSKNFRVVSFEYPGIGFSYPNSNYDYSIKKGAQLIDELMNLLQIDKASLLFSCSNGFYAIKMAELFPEKINQLFLSQTPSIQAMVEWTDKSIPAVLKSPIIGQISNLFSNKKFAKLWYNYALPKQTAKKPYQKTAIQALHNGACFCLSGLVQGLIRDKESNLYITKTPTTLIWGSKDFTHRKTNINSIQEHIPNCEIVEFEDCGHFPELENTTKFVKLIHKKLLP